MKALISPNEPVETGYRVAQVAQLEFEVAPPLFWADCTDEITADVYWYNPETQTFIQKEMRTFVPVSLAEDGLSVIDSPANQSHEFIALEDNSRIVNIIK